MYNSFLLSNDNLLQIFVHTILFTVRLDDINQSSVYAIKNERQNTPLSYNLSVIIQIRVEKHLKDLIFLSHIMLFAFKK